MSSAELEMLYPSCSASARAAMSDGWAAPTAAPCSRASSALAPRVGPRRTRRPARPGELDHARPKSDLIAAVVQDEAYREQKRIESEIADILRALERALDDPIRDGQSVRGQLEGTTLEVELLWSVRAPSNRHEDWPVATKTMRITAPELDLASELAFELHTQRGPVRHWSEEGLAKPLELSNGRLPEPFWLEGAPAPSVLELFETTDLLGQIRGHRKDLVSVTAVPLVVTTGRFVEQARLGSLLQLVLGLARGCESASAIAPTGIGRGYRGAEALDGAEQARTERADQVREYEEMLELRAEWRDPAVLQQERAREARAAKNLSERRWSERKLVLTVAVWLIVAVAVLILGPGSCLLDWIRAIFS